MSLNGEQMGTKSLQWSISIRNWRNGIKCLSEFISLKKYQNYELGHSNPIVSLFYIDLIKDTKTVLIKASSVQIHTQTYNDIIVFSSLFGLITVVIKTSSLVVIIIPVIHDVNARLGSLRLQVAALLNWVFIYTKSRVLWLWHWLWQTSPVTLTHTGALRQAMLSPLTGWCVVWESSLCMRVF